MRRELLGPVVGRPRTLRYLVGLSAGVSSAALVQMLAENREYLVSSSKSKTVPVAFEAVAVHIDTDLTPRDGQQQSPAANLMERYAERFPGIEFRCVPLSAALEVEGIDWGDLLPGSEDIVKERRLQDVFDRLPSLTSRADVLRLLVRHVLLSEAVRSECDALLLGCSTTALAEMTLSEVAKGRGFSVPWQVNDGPFPLPRQRIPNGEDATAESTSRSTMNLYYPLRDVFRKEINTYLRISTPAIDDIIVETAKNSQTVVSHKDISIEDAISQYFETVEEGYPAVVANVVKTTGKLSRIEDGSGFCSLCGLGVDEQGDARWKGEIGQDEPRSQQVEVVRPLCYGCERSIRG
jgi:cytoplasmic tRNA 2-thiolation protein 2